MNIKIFGKLQEVFSTEILVIPLQKDHKSLSEYLYATYPSLHNYNFLISVNHIICLDELLSLNPTDEIALLPPFSGG